MVFIARLLTQAIEPQRHREFLYRGFMKFSMTLTITLDELPTWTAAAVRAAGPAPPVDRDRFYSKALI